MIRKNIFIALCLSVLVVNTACAQTNKPATLKFTDLQAYDQARETFRIEGYALDIYKCPPCPPGAMCKPCIPDNITLVDKADWKDLSTLHRLRLYTDKTENFKVGGKYMVTVHASSGTKIGQPITSADLISIDSSSAADMSGTWEGQSICTVRPSSCNDEQVIFRPTEPDAQGKLRIEMDKVVNGNPDDMGTLDCQIAGLQITCSIPKGIWEFNISGPTITGTLTLDDGRLFRRVSLSKNN